MDCLVEKVTDPFNNVPHEYFGRAKTLVTKYHMRRLFCRAKNLLTKYHMSTDCLGQGSHRYLQNFVKRVLALPNCLGDTLIKGCWP